jgi:hypothetical protein
MTLPEPAIGLVIRHAYLWWNEARAGREEGRKDRPCVIVHLRLDEQQQLETYICPITHTPPDCPENAMEIPQATKARLGLDGERSWIITTEVNRFLWPGPDIRPTTEGKYSYGLLPAAMARDLITQLRANTEDKSLLITTRSK